MIPHSIVLGFPVYFFEEKKRYGIYRGTVNSFYANFNLSRCPLACGILHKRICKIQKGSKNEYIKTIFPGYLRMLLLVLLHGTSKSN